jgi:hypothetical protein
LVYISWHRSPSQRRTSYILPISPCVYMCIHLIFARQLLGKYVPAATNTRNSRRIDWRATFYAGRVVSKENRRLVLPRTSLFLALCKRNVTQMCPLSSSYPPVVYLHISRGRLNRFSWNLILGNFTVCHWIPPPPINIWMPETWYV